MRCEQAADIEIDCLPGRCHARHCHASDPTQQSCALSAVEGFAVAHSPCARSGRRMGQDKSKQRPGKLASKCIIRTNERRTRSLAHYPNESSQRTNIRFSCTHNSDSVCHRIGGAGGMVAGPAKNTSKERARDSMVRRGSPAWPVGRTGNPLTCY